MRTVAGADQSLHIPAQTACLMRTVPLTGSAGNGITGESAGPLTVAAEE